MRIQLLYILCISRGAFHTVTEHGPQSRGAREAGHYEINAFPRTEVQVDSADISRSRAPYLCHPPLTLRLPLLPQGRVELMSLLYGSALHASVLYVQ